MRQPGQFGLGLFNRRNIGKDRDVVSDLPLGIGDRTHGLPLRVDLAAFAPVPDLAVPITVFLQ